MKIEGSVLQKLTASGIRAAVKIREAKSEASKSATEGRSETKFTSVWFLFRLVKCEDNFDSVSYAGCFSKEDTHFEINITLKLKKNKRFPERVLLVYLCCIYAENFIRLYLKL